ncbi:MAG: hypothetical protein ABW022_27010 [Actinoplanes sp.]
MLSLVYAATSIPFTIYLLSAYFRTILNLMTAQKAAADYGRLYAGMVIVIVPGARSPPSRRSWP